LDHRLGVGRSENERAVPPGKHHINDWKAIVLEGNFQMGKSGSLASMTKGKGTPNVDETSSGGEPCKGDEKSFSGNNLVEVWEK